MIPNIQPPPHWLPQGWTPNALGPTAAQLATSPNIGASVVQTTLLAAQAAGFLYSLAGTWSQAQFAALNATPQIVIPAPDNSDGINRIVQPVFYMLTANTTVAWGNSPTLRVRYVGSTQDLLTGSNMALNSVRRCWLLMGESGGGDQFLSNVLDIRNRAVQVDMSLALAGAGTTSDIAWRIFFNLLNVP